MEKENQPQVEIKYHDNGAKKIEIPYIEEWEYCKCCLFNGIKPHGIVTFWSETGQKELELNYVDGVLNGKSTYWHLNGNKKTEAFYKDGKEDGIKYDWNKLGNLIKETTYVDGVKKGPFKIWHSNGVLSIEGNYCETIENLEKNKIFTLIISKIFSEDEYCDIQNEFLDGTIKFYSENGNLIKQLNFKNGKRDGEQTTYYESGQLKSHHICKDGVVIECKTTFFESGKIESRAFYHKGFLSQIIYCDKNGDIISQHSYHNDSPELDYSVFFKKKNWLQKLFS